MAGTPQAVRPAAALLLALLALASVPQAQCQRAWVYTLVSADYGGEVMLPHFINYYHQLGITYRRFLVIVHHTPGKYPRRGLELITGICQGYSVECRVWEGEFSSEAHMERQLHMLNDFVFDQNDWVIAADSDELQEWPKPIKETLQDVNAAGGTYVNGFLVDRVAPGGAVPRLASAAAVDAAAPPPPSLFVQFPLRCRLVHNLYRGWDFKVVAFRAYLRAGRANHKIVTPDAARAYYGPCTDLAPGVKCPRGRNINLDADFFNLTPYHRYEEHYRYAATPAGRIAKGHALWHAHSAKGFRLAVHHFKWHAGVVDSLRDRAELYGGDCVLGVREEGCTPRLLHWRESARAYAALAGGRALNLTGMQCEAPAAGPPAPGAIEARIDTTYPGTAWEAFDKSLGVVAKLRTTTRGDSQTRQAARLAAGLSPGTQGGDANAGEA